LLNGASSGNKGAAKFAGYSDFLDWANFAGR
jgi:hypothetical protein